MHSTTARLSRRLLLVAIALGGSSLMQQYLHNRLRPSIPPESCFKYVLFSFEKETFGICYIDVASTLLTALSARSRNETLFVYTARRGARPVIQGRNRFKSALPVTEQQ